MSAQYYLTCLWPGLAELWWRGRLSSVPTALGFAAALNLMLVMRFLYPEWLTSGLVRLACWVGVAVWLYLVVQAIRELPGLIAPRSVSDEPDRFPEARHAYLNGNWSEAEGLFTDLLAIEPRDPPSLLLLCGVYRRTDRLDAATQLLDEIKRLEAADGWWMEIAAEQRRIERLSANDEPDDSDKPNAQGQKEEGQSGPPSEPADLTEPRDEESSRCRLAS